MTADPSAALAAIRARVEVATEGPWQMLVGNSWAGEVVVATEGGHPLALVSTAKDDAAAQADAAFVAHARDDVPRMADAIAAVLALHQPSDGSRWPESRCHHDGDLYPCPTVAAITDALGGEG